MLLDHSAKFIKLTKNVISSSNKSGTFISDILIVIECRINDVS
jgi:hypothetical protein